MLSIEPGNASLGATVAGVDLSKPLSDRDFGRILEAIGKFGLLRFPAQTLTPEQQKVFCLRFGSVKPITGRLAPYTEPGFPEINIVSNIKVDGKFIGAADAGVIWHTDMIHNTPPGFANVLYALKIPRRDGKTLGGTEFIDGIAAYDDLPAEVKAKIENARGVYTGETYNGVARTPANDYSVNSYKGNTKVAVTQPAVLTHPISGRKTLYLDPGHVDGIQGLPAGEAEAMTVFLIEHLMKPKYRFVYTWTEGDLVIWDNLRSFHRAVFDYGPDEPRLIRRCQVQGEKVFDPAFVKTALEKARAAA